MNISPKLCVPAMVNINTLSQIALLILKKADPFKGRPTETGHRGYLLGIG